MSVHSWGDHPSLWSQVPSPASGPMSFVGDGIPPWSCPKSCSRPCPGGGTPARIGQGHPPPPQDRTGVTPPPPPDRRASDVMPPAVSLLRFFDVCDSRVERVCVVAPLVCYCEG